MDNIKRKNKTMTVIIIVLIISILGTTYAFVNLSPVSNNSMTGEGDCNSVNYAATGDNITGLSVTSDYTKGAKATVTLSQDSNCPIYTEASIYIYTEESITAPIDEHPALKFKVFNGSTLINEGTITEKGTATLLADNLDLLKETTYTIYIWIDSTQSYGYYHGKTYSGKIYAESTQTSTIDE